MAFSTSIPLFLVATVCCHIANAAGENFRLLPSIVSQHRPKQMFTMPPPLYNYYNPYGVYGPQFFMPTAQGDINAELLKDDSEVTGRQSSEDVSIAPVATECLKGDVGTNGFGGCAKGSRASSGNIIVKFTAADQVAIVALVPNPKKFSKVKITCSDLTSSVVYTKSGKIAATTDSPVTETKQTQVVIVSSDVGSAECSWEAS